MIVVYLSSASVGAGLGMSEICPVNSMASAAPRCSVYDLLRDLLLGSLDADRGVLMVPALIPGPGRKASSSKREGALCSWRSNLYIPPDLTSADFLPDVPLTFAVGFAG